MRIKEAVEKSWTITPYEFITATQFDEMRKDPEKSFIVLIQVKFPGDKIEASYSFLSVLLGSAVKKITDMSGVGISFGADRIYDVMTQLNLFPAESAASSKLLFVNFGDQEAIECLKLLAQTRALGIASELYPDPAKMKKQLEYANKKNIPFVALIGANEIEQNIANVKIMATGEQHQVPFHHLAEFISNQ